MSAAMTGAASVAVAVEVARDLARHGVPVFVAKPALDENGQWLSDGGHSGCGYWMPPKWENTAADPATVDTWEPGDALAAVMGHGIDGVDVDPRHGGDDTARDWQAAGMWPRSLGRQSTPSGGWHDLVNRLGVRSLDGALPGVDVKAGDADGNGRGFLFIAPTAKLSKATGEIGRYEWTSPPELHELDPLDDSGAALAERITASRTPLSPIGDTPHDAYDAMTPEKQVSVGNYLAVTVRNIAAELTEVAGWAEGYRDDRNRGWQKALADPCNRMGRLARADWTPWTMAEAEARLRAIVPMSIAAAIGFEDTWAAHRGRRSPAPWPTTLDAVDLYVQSLESLPAPAVLPTGETPPALEDLLNIVTASDVEISRVRYLWQGRIPFGAMTLMPGEEGIGKTTVGVNLIAQITTGTLDGEMLGTPRDVLVLATEDGIEDVFTPRLKEAGADLTRVHIIKARVALDGSDLDVIVPRDLKVISLAVQKYDAALVWIDSLVTTLPDELKTIAYKDTAKVLKQLSGWAERHSLAVAAPWHLNKASGSDTAIRIMDSRAFRTAVRSMLLIVADPDAEEGVSQGIVALDKSNASSLAVPALRYRINSAPYVVAEVDKDTGEVRDIPASCGVVEWLGEVDGDGRAIAREALTPLIYKEGTPAGWLRDYLKGEGEAVRADVMLAAETERFSESAIKRASRSIGVVSREETGQDVAGRPFRRAVWSLPDSQSGQRPLQSGHTHPTGPNDPTGEGYIGLTDLIGAGQSKSGQSGQSGLSGPTGENSDPTEDSPIPRDFYSLFDKTPNLPTECKVCTNPLHLVDGRDTCEACRLKLERQ